MVGRLNNSTGSLAYSPESVNSVGFIGDLTDQSEVLTEIMQWRLAGALSLAPLA